MNCSMSCRPSGVVSWPRATCLPSRRMVRVCVELVERAPERRQPLVPHQHQEVDLGQVPGCGGVEAAGTVLDGPGAVEGNGLAGTQDHAPHRLGGEALDGVAVESRDVGLWLIRHLAVQFNRGLTWIMPLLGMRGPHYICR